MDETRRAARWRRRRIIYNNDGDDVIATEKERGGGDNLTVRTARELMDDFLDARTRPLVGTQVDSNWYCSCMAGVRFSHRTRLGGFHDEGIPQELVERYGRDSLQIQTDFCRRNNMEAFWSLRMNDCHDAHPMGTRRWTYGLAPFKRDHPQFLMGEPGDWDKYEGTEKTKWTCLDFSFPEVREHIFSIIAEVAQRYDVDGMELDFFRHYPYFRPTREMLPVEPRHLDMMTDLVRRVARLAAETGAQRGRPLLLAVRVPFNLADARFIGLDLERWLAEDLVDLLVAGGGSESYLAESFAPIIELGHRHEVPVFPSLNWGFWNHWAYLDHSQGRHRTYDAWVDSMRRPGVSATGTINEWKGTMPAWRAAATNLFNAGADGIYTFNGFFASPEVWREIGDPDTLASKDKIFGIENFGGDSSFNQIREVALQPNAPLHAHFQVGENLSAGTTAELRFRLHLWDLVEKDEIRVKLNDAMLDDLMPDAPLQTTPAGYWLGCRLRPEQVRRGENKVEILLQRQGETAAALDSIQLSVRYGGAGGE